MQNLYGNENGYKQSTGNFVFTVISLSEKSCLVFFVLILDPKMVILLTIWKHEKNISYNQ